MSKEILLKRGSRETHETYVGRKGEVTVDTSTRSLRVHDGETPGGNPAASVDMVVLLSAIYASMMGWRFEYDEATGTTRSILDFGVIGEDEVSGTEEGTETQITDYGTF